MTTCNPNDILKEVMKARGFTYTSLAQKMGWIVQQLSQRLRRGTLRADEFLKLLSIMNVKMRIVLEESDHPVMPIPPDRRSKEMVDGILYFPKYGEMISHDYCAYGKESYENGGYVTVLCRDRDGRYFFVKYSQDPAKDKIEGADIESALDFILKYGRAIDGSADTVDIKLILEGTNPESEETSEE